VAAKKPATRKKPRNEARLLVRTSDGALFNYTPALAQRPDMKLHSGSAPTPAQIEKITGKDPDEFNVAKARSAELVKFAKDEYGVDLDPAIPLNVLRGQVMQLGAKAAEDAAKE